MQDLIRFFVFYALVLVAFSTAFRALFLLSADINPDHPHVWSVMFGTFNIMFDSGKRISVRELTTNLEQGMWISSLH